MGRYGSAFTVQPLTGLNVSVNGGVLGTGGAPIFVLPGNLALTASTTNFVFLTNAGIISSNTSGFTAGTIPLAQVVTGPNFVVSVTDVSPDYWNWMSSVAQTIGGVVGSYNGLTTAGQGLAPIVAAVSLATQGFAVFNSATPVTLVPSGSANAGTYRVSVYMVVTTVFTVNTTEIINIAYTDDNKAQTIATASCVLAAGTEASSVITLRSTGATALTYAPGVTGSAATGGAASFSVVVERLI